MTTKGERMILQIHQSINQEKRPILTTLDPLALPFKPNARSHKSNISGTLVPAFIIGTKRCYNTDYFICLTLDYSRKKYSHKLILCKKQPKVVAEKLKKLMKNDPAIQLNLQPVIKANIELNLPKNQCFIVEGTMTDLNRYRDYYREGYSGILAHNFSAWLNLDFVKPQNFIPTRSDYINQNANLSQYFEHQMCHFNWIRQKALENFGIEKYPSMMEVRFSRVYKSDQNTNLKFNDQMNFGANKNNNNKLICNTIPVEINGYRPQCQNHKNVRIYHGCPKFKPTDVDFDYPTKYFKPVYWPEVGPRYLILRHDYCQEERYVLYSIVSKLD